MLADLTAGQAFRRQRQHDLVDPAQPALPLADQDRFKAAVPIPGHLDAHWA